VDLSLTDKDGKQDAEEDDDEKHELHEFFFYSRLGRKPYAPPCEEATGFR
jgi:hypothetical protein